MRRLIVSFLLTLFVVFFWSGVGFMESQVWAKKTRGAVIRLNDFKIVGRIQKPQAFYVLSRSPLNYKSLKFKEDFVKKVIESVKKAPF